MFVTIFHANTPRPPLPNRVQVKTLGFGMCRNRDGQEEVWVVQVGRLGGAPPHAPLLAAQPAWCRTLGAHLLVAARP